MTNWRKCIDILRRSNLNDFRLIVFELAKTDPTVLVKVVKIIQERREE